VNLCVAFLVSLLLHLAQAGWQANPQTVRETAAKQPGFNYEEARVPAYTLFALWGDRPLVAEARVSRAHRRPQPHPLRLAVLHGLRGQAVEVALAWQAAPPCDVQAARLPADTSNDHDDRD
jgi:hypothetical protein